ncbi:hypothetical protein NIES4073_03510 (plasmid) [Kalymmatonema gypsitolerans NIES-4073]|nr:hypothetical protein NIES4073_03510 [Scytonema sp. NIES-4073]
MKVHWRHVPILFLELTGTLTILGGGIALLVRTSGCLMISTGQKLQPYERLFALMQVYGLLSTGYGMISTGAGMAATQYLAQQEERPQQEQQRDLTIPPACKSCRNYHGQWYGTNRLICGIHPYGWSDENCPDYEQEEQ